MAFFVFFILAFTWDLATQFIPISNYLSDKAPVFLTMFTITISIYIAYIQRNQLDKLENIGMQTSETVEKLQTQEVIQDRIKKFFLIPGGREKRKIFKCIFPVEYRSKPLPLINQGDFYAIHVLSTRLGEENLELRGITRDEVVEDSLLKDNIIFICTPAVNPALQMLFEIKKIENDEDLKNLKQWPLDPLGIPCWFVDDCRGNHPIRKIKIFDGSELSELLESPSEDCYISARKLKEGVRYEPMKKKSKRFWYFCTNK